MLSAHAPMFQAIQEIEHRFKTSECTPERLRTLILDATENEELADLNYAKAILQQTRSHESTTATR